MDTHLFADRAPDRSLPEDGPLNIRRVVVYTQSLWFNIDHERFDPCRFEDYLTVRGWERELIMNGKWREAHPDNVHKNDQDCILDTIAVLQGWLTLGFLEDLFQNRQLTKPYLRPLPEAVAAGMQNLPVVSDVWPKVRRNSAGNALIFDTKHLVSNLVYLLIQRNRSKLASEHLARLPILIGCFGRAVDDLGDINVYNESSNTTRQPIYPDLECVAFLRFFKPVPMLIFEAVRHTLSPHTPEINVDSREWEHHITESLHRENGWCPRTIARLLSTTNLSVVHWLWASNFNNVDAREHSDCSSSKCHAQHMSSKVKYPEKHASGCDGHCPRYLPDVSQIKHALSQDQIPIVVAHPSNLDNESHVFSISSFSPETGIGDSKFIAFSHVWSDGLGSNTEQGIPSCQSNYLAKVCRTEAQQPDGSSAFWIDSLCIPGETTARRKAIQMMAFVYQQAKAVLVLDDTMRKITLNDNYGNPHSPELLLLRIYTSPWNSRVWTYQEGALARRLVFILARDQKLALDFPHDLDSGPHVSPVSVQRGRDLMRHVYCILRDEVQALNGQLSPIGLGIVALQLRWRDTLHRDPQGRNDEILAIGTVLGLNMKILLDEPEGPRRMARFYRLIGRLHKNIVFADAPRLQIDGFRWAPTTFLVEDSRRPHQNLDHGGVDCTEHGLLGSYVTFSVNDATIVHYDGSRRVTLVDGQRFFDVYAEKKDDRVQSFRFSHIIIYPSELPNSTRVPLFVAAALLEDKHFPVTQQNNCRPDFTATFQAVVHLLWLRDWDHPVNRSFFPNGETHATFTAAEQTILIR